MSNVLVRFLGAVAFISLLACAGNQATSPVTRPEIAMPDSAAIADSIRAADSLAVLDSLLAAEAAQARLDSIARADSLAAAQALADSLAAVQARQDSLKALADAAASAKRTAERKRAAADTLNLKPNPRALRFNGIYLNSGAVGNLELMAKYIEKARQYDIGGFVMDMKDDRGYLTWRSENPVAKKIGANTNRVKDPAALVKMIHDAGLVASARVVSFKDPLLSNYSENGAYPYAVLDSTTDSPWKQRNGETWANMMDPAVYGYLTGIISELVAFGFDQIQLDYIRFPSDGPMDRILYPVAIDSLNKVEVIGKFLSRVRGVVDSADVSLAVDVFGWVPWLSLEKSQWIGQNYDEIARWSDVICPMLYSSHFPDDFKKEAGTLRAYEIIFEGTRKGVVRRGSNNTGVQPYIQAFNYRSPHYGEDYILQQMQASREGGAIGWIAWNARSDYSMLWKALEKNANSSRDSTESQ
jgi:hypothetical protein